MYPDNSYEILGFPLDDGFISTSAKKQPETMLWLACLERAIRDKWTFTIDSNKKGDKAVLRKMGWYAERHDTLPQTESDAIKSFYKRSYQTKLVMLDEWVYSDKAEPCNLMWIADCIAENSMAFCNKIRSMWNMPETYIRMNTNERRYAVRGDRIR